MAFIYSFTDLWNAGGTTFDAIKVDVTDTASAAASLLLNLSVGGSVKFSVRKDGHVVAATEAIGGATIGTNALAVAGNANFASSGFFIDGITGFNRQWNAGYYGFSNNTNAQTGSTDTNISRNAAGVIQFGTTVANAAGSWLATNGTLSGALVVSGTADASAVTGSGALQVAGGASIAKRLWIPAITASAGLQTAVLCQSSGGEMIADSVACLASSERFKTILGTAEAGAIDKISRVPIHRWKYKEEGIFKSENWTREHIGPTAEEIEAIDSRLVGYDNEGKARNISQEQLLALAIQAIQEQQVQIEELKARAA